MNPFLNIGLITGVILIAMMAIGLILARMYKRASKEIAFVRTGFGGQKIVMNGGALVFPVLHETIPVNMNTLRLEVRRANEQALITRDRIRVDVQAEFYVRVKPTQEAIADAAQTLGMRTMKPEALKELIEGKFVDALRSVAAEMTMEELHEQRVDFVQKVQKTVSEDLLKNGLELESVSLTGLDQTSREHFNPQNAFDAQGLTKLTEQIEALRKKRNDVEQDTQIQIQTKNLETERKRLELAREEEYARLEQEREIAIRRAAQTTEVARERAEKDREAKEAEIAAKQQVDKAQIGAERAVEEERIEKERQLKEREIAKIKAIETAEVEKQKAIALAEQERAIAIAERSKAQSEAQAEADRARATAVKAEEEVVTVREKERAERQKQIELIEAAKEAEREAIGMTIAAEAEKKVAADKAIALKTLAEAEAEKLRIAAQGEADAEKLRAEGAERRYVVDAAGRRALHEADNILSAEQIALRMKLAIVEHLAEIVRESVKPMEQIESIKIVQVDGLTSSGGVTNGENSMGRESNLADQVINSALRYRAQAPLLDALLREIGISSSDIHGLTSVLLGQKPLIHPSEAATDQPDSKTEERS
jgi:uncharacterized membrane protein YqiK